MEYINKAAAVSLVLFVAIFAAFLGARIDQTTIALLGGTLIGLLIGVLATLLVVVLAVRRRDEVHYDRPARYAAHMPPSPPQYWSLPGIPTPTHDARLLQAMPPSALQPGIPAPDYMLPPIRRRFYMIGEDGEVREIEAPHGDGLSDDPSADDARF